VRARLMVGGDHYRVYALASRTRCQADTFISRLPKADKRAIAALLDRTAKHGLSPNPERFRKEEGHIWVFKRHQVRLYCFLDSDANGRTVVITHGLRKKRNKARRIDLTKAEALRQQFIDGGSKYD